MADSRKASVTAREGLERGLQALQFRTSVINYLLRVLRQPLAIAEGSGPSAQLQNALPATIPLYSTPKELTLTARGHYRSLLSRPDQPPPPR